MSERLLQFIWQFGYFNKNNLQTTDVQTVMVIHPGMHNTNQGPDFLNAQIKIGNTLWAGSVEIHINTSEWKAHQHSNDDNYKNVILHVVWNDDANLNLPFPTLELKNRIPKPLLKKYEALMQGAPFIPCEKLIGNLDPLLVISFKERLLVERLQHKVMGIEKTLQQQQMHWEEIFWRMLARNFGAQVNGDAFELIAESIPLNILSKHKNQLIQLEALLMGQAGLLEQDFNESYPAMLQKEYRFLKKKYKLAKLQMTLHFLRMRPANFPTLRLAQLASFIHHSDRLFSKIREATELTEVEKLFMVTANDYWHYHYVFEEPGHFKKKTLGKEMIRNILINTVVPVLFAYGHINKLSRFKDRAVQWMEKMPAENNRITNTFEKLGIENKSAGDSQALIQLKHAYCDQKRCLQCTIGMSILKDN